MKTIINKTIQGVPYSRGKKRGYVQGVKEWRNQVRKQSRCWVKVTEECRAEIIFYLPKDKYPEDLPYGSDLDNLLKVFFDALNETVFKNVAGKDSCIKELVAKKQRVSTRDKAGAKVTIKRLR